jgi:3'(2'), 5'-bisphosphate nucleotidase
MSAISDSADGPATIDLAAEKPDTIARFFAEIVLAAGPVVMEEYVEACAVRAKSDMSPVTIADERAEALIIERLRSRAAPIPIVAEESAARGESLAIGPAFVLVDPLDGTREFISRNGEFTINIALVRHGAVTAGAVYAPAISRLWFGGETAFGCAAPLGAGLPPTSAWRALRCRAAPPHGLVALASRSHGDAATESFLAKLHIAERRSAGSSLKFCLLAEGEADVYPRFGPTMEWDTAAGEAVLRAAGGTIAAAERGPFLYGKTAQGFRNGGFVAWADPELAARVPHA